MNDKYLTFGTTALAADDQFIQWVKLGQPADSPWGQWVLNHPEKSSEVAEAAQMITALQFDESPTPNIDTDQLWNRINSTIAKEKETPVVTLKRPGIFRIVGYAAAAALAALVMFQVWMNGGEEIYAPKGQTMAHVLPDQSEVQLNADSKITYDKDDWGKERNLVLEGEAYFKVEKGQKFSVKTQHGTITVLGTSFNIYSRKDAFKVHCTSGRVEVRTNKNNSVVLTPDTKTSLSASGTLVKESLEKAQSVDWLDKIYRFDRIPLHVVFGAVGRQFNVEITMDAGISDRLFTGSFDATDLNKALNVICFPMELSPIIQGDKIRIQHNEGN